MLTLNSRGQKRLISGAEGGAERLQLVSLHAEADHVLQPHLVWAVHHVLIILQHRSHVTTTRQSVNLTAHVPEAPTSNSEGASGVLRTPCTLWYPSGASVRVGSLLRTSWHRPSATSHTRSSREPSVALGCEYFRLVLERQSLRQHHHRSSRGTFLTVY